MILNCIWEFPIKSNLNFSDTFQTDDIYWESPSKSRLDFQADYFRNELKLIQCEIDDLSIDKNLGYNISQLIGRCRNNISLLDKEVSFVKTYTSSTNINSYKVIKDNYILNEVRCLLGSFESLVIELNKLMDFSLFSTWDCVCLTRSDLKELLNHITKSNQKVSSKIKSRLVRIIIHQINKAKKYKLFKGWLLSYLDNKHNFEKFIFNSIKTLVSFFELIKIIKYEFKFHRIYRKSKERWLPNLR